MQRRVSLFLAGVALACLAPAAGAQDTNVIFPVDTIEQRLLTQPLQIADSRGSRFEGDRTQRVLLQFADNSMMVKWAKSAKGGQAFNNQPRYEIAAYELQKLFLDEPDYVVPPTVPRMVPLSWYRELEPAVTPTFDGLDQVLVVLQYWLSNVTPKDVYDPKRLQSDTAYARHFGNLNLLTYLIRQSDANQGNILISQDSARPRMFSVDNGVSFASDPSNRGLEWRDLRADRLPKETIDRLRQTSLEDLERALGVFAEWEIDGNEVAPAPPGANLGKNRGVRRTKERLQLGLTSAEIRAVHGRIQRLLRQVDSGRIKTF